MKAAKSIIGNIRHNLKFHLVDSTAILAESTPVFAVFETQIAGWSNELSINARLIAAGITYFAGTGYIYGKGRDLSRRLFNIGDETTEKVQALHDAVYLAAFNLVIAPPIYFAAGARDLKQIAIGTATVMAVALVNGGPLGYAVDLFRDLAGLKECRRPSYRFLKKQTPRVKRVLVVLLTAAAVAVTGGIYALRN